MAITGANNINSVYSTFQNKMFQRVLQSSGMADSSIFGSMTGSSGATLGSADMSSLMQLMMMMKMMESMGMDMSDLTGTSSGTDNTTTTTTTTVAGKPSTSNITTGGSIKIGNSTDAETITGTTWNTALNTVESFTIGNETYYLVDNIGIGGDGNKGFKNVFKKGEGEDGQYYYYANGKLQEIDNTNTIDASGNTKLVYNNTVYNYVKQEGTTITLQKSESDTTGAVTATLVGSTGGDDSAPVYKIGNTSYELRGGVFVARSSSLAKEGTLDIVGSSAAFDTITEYVAGSRIVTQNNGTYTRVYQDSNEKRFDASRNIYHDGTNYYEASGATLTQIDVNDLSYFAGYSSLDNSEGSAIFAGLNLADKLNENDPNITFFTKEVNGETRLFTIDAENTEVDVTDNAMYYSQAKIGQNEATYNMEVTDNSISLTSATGVDTTLTRLNDANGVQYKEGIYKTGDTVGTNSGLKTNSYYRFDGGRFVEVTAPAEIYARISASDLNDYSSAPTSFNTSNIDTDKYQLGDAVGSDFESANLAAADGAPGTQYMQWEGENVTIYQRVANGSPVAVERFTKKQDGVDVYYERSVKVKLKAIEGKGGSDGQTAWVTDSTKYQFDNGQFSRKTDS